MSRNRKKDRPPDARHLGIIIGEEEDGSWFDIGRFGELEALGISAAQRANRSRDELIRRATIMLCRMERNTTLDDIKALGVRGLRQKGIEYVLEPSHDVFVIFDWEDGRRGQPRFWVFLCLHVLTPGGGSPIVRGPDDNPVAGVQLRIGGDRALIGAIQSEDWHALSTTIWNAGDDDDDAGRDPESSGTEPDL